MTTASEGSGAGKTAPSRLTFWDGQSEHTLAHALVPPAVHCVETYAADGGGQPVPAAKAGRRLGLLLTARSAYRHPVARVFTAALHVRLDLSMDDRERVHTATQEALMNAVIHGSLRLEAGLRDDLQGLAKLRERIETGFASADVARSRIGLDATWTSKMLHLVVRDSGPGFKRAALLSPGERRAVAERGSGRGFPILRALCDDISFPPVGSAIKLSFLR